jgi:methyl-accepting chemotaxis protein
MFTNMNVGTRLGAGFGFVVILMLAIAAIGVSRLAAVSDSMNEVVTDKWPKTVMANEVLADSNAIAIALRNMMLTTSKDDRSANEQRVLAARKRIAGNVEKLEKVLTLPKGKELFKAVLDARAKYLSGQEALIKLINDGKEAESRLYLQNELRPTLQIYQASLGNLVSFQGELMDAEGKAAMEQYRAARSLMIGLSVVALLLAISMALWITLSITRPLKHGMAVAKALAKGDLTAQVRVGSHDETGQLLIAMREMVAKFSQIIGQVRGASDALASASEEVSATAQSLSQASSEQAAGVEETTASVEEISASIAQNTENAKVTEGIAQKASSEASEGGVAVAQTVDAMKQIAGKIGIIDDIAYQTNLLALNAAIEAARAGEHGKGFAVVAAEVRKLAERSQVAAQEIGELASSSVAKAEKAGKILDEMVPSIQKTADLVQEIAAASREQQAGVAQINGAMGQLNQATQANASSSEELAATAEEMGGQAEQLQELMTFFKVEDGSAAQPARPPAPPARMVQRTRPTAGTGPSRATSAQGDFERF